MTENVRPPLIDNVMNHSVEHMLGSLIGYRSTLEILAARHVGNSENSMRIRACLKKLDEAERAVIPGIAGRRKIFAAWNLLHQVSEELFVLLTHAELVAEGRKLLADMKISSLPESTRKEWEKRIEECLSELKPGADIGTCAHTLKMAMNTLNTHMDTLFWDIWIKKLFTLIYTVILFALLIALYFRIGDGETDINMATVLLLGATGGVASGIMTAEPLYIAKGHFWVSFYYYMLSRPVQGALAALIMFWLLQSQYLIQIQPAIDEKPVFSMATSAKPKAELQANMMTASADGTRNTHKEPTTLIVLNAAKSKQGFLYLLVLLVAGFTGDKLLKTVSEKVTSRLYLDAEKTKESKDGK